MKTNASAVAAVIQGILISGKEHLIECCNQSFHRVWP